MLSQITHKIASKTKGLHNHHGLDHFPFVMRS